MCACHPCAGAMLIFSVSFQFFQMPPEGGPTTERVCMLCRVGRLSTPREWFESAFQKGAPDRGIEPRARA